MESKKIFESASSSVLPIRNFEDEEEPISENIINFYRIPFILEIICNCYAKLSETDQSLIISMLSTSKCIPVLFPVKKDGEISKMATTLGKPNECYLEPISIFPDLFVMNLPEISKNSSYSKFFKDVGIRKNVDLNVVLERVKRLC